MLASNTEGEVSGGRWCGSCPYKYYGIVVLCAEHELRSALSMDYRSSMRDMADSLGALAQRAMVVFFRRGFTY